MKDYKVPSYLSVVAFLLILVPFGLTIYLQWQRMVEEFNRPGYELTLQKSSKVSTEEKMEIDIWLRDNNLNEYGDPKDTVYTGGTPLFNEKTGQRMNRYEYILKKYPSRPWQK